MPVIMKRKDRTDTIIAGGFTSQIHWVLDLHCRKLYLALQWRHGKDGEVFQGHCPLTMDKTEVQLTDIDLKDLLAAIYVAYQAVIPGPVKNLKAAHEEITRRGQFMDSKAALYVKGVSN